MSFENDPAGVGVPGEEDPRRLVAALGYIFTPVVPLISMTSAGGTDRWTRYHAVQALLWSGPFAVLLVASILLLVLLTQGNVLFICLLPIMLAAPFAPGSLWARRIYLGGEVSIPIIGEQATRRSGL